MRFLSPHQALDLEEVRTAWQGFVDGRQPAPPGVRSHVLRAWQRSRQAGCDARLARAQVLPEPETRQLLHARAPLLRLSEPFMAALSRAAGADRHAAMLADRDGRLLRVIGDPETMSDENFPRPGALMTEDLAGANGIGTPLAENGYVELVGPEHFIEGFHAFTCQGVPLRGPSGVEGVLSVSARRLQTAERVRDILFCATEATECELLAAWLADSIAAPVEPVLEQLRQDMLRRISGARLQLELAARQIAAGVDAGTTLEGARHLSRKFSRQAALWRSLALAEQQSPVPERIDLAELVVDFLELMQTEASVLSIEILWGRFDRVFVLAAPGLLSCRLLNGFLTALQNCDTGRLEVTVQATEDAGEVILGTKDGPGQPRRSTVAARAPLLR